MRMQKKTLVLGVLNTQVFFNLSSSCIVCFENVLKDLHYDVNFGILRSDDFFISYDLCQMPEWLSVCTNCVYTTDSDNKCDNCHCSNKAEFLIFHFNKGFTKDREWSFFCKDHCCKIC